MKALGFTGTRHGMTPDQRYTLASLLKAQSPFELHHGGCSGADFEAGVIAKSLGARIVLHPPIGMDPASMIADEVRVALPYLKRNDAIVTEGVDGLFAATVGRHEILRSGTWSTVRRARKLGRKIWIVWPGGHVTVEG